MCIAEGCVCVSEGMEGSRDMAEARYHNFYGLVILIIIVLLIYTFNTNCDGQSKGFVPSCWWNLGRAVNLSDLNHMQLLVQPLGERFVVCGCCLVQSS